MFKKKKKDKDKNKKRLKLANMMNDGDYK